MIISTFTYSDSATNIYTPNVKHIGYLTFKPNDCGEALALTTTSKAAQKTYLTSEGKVLQLKAFVFMRRILRGISPLELITYNTMDNYELRDYISELVYGSSSYYNTRLQFYKRMKYLHTRDYDDTSIYAFYLLRLFEKYATSDVKNKMSVNWEAVIEPKFHDVINVYRLDESFTDYSFIVNIRKYVADFLDMVNTENKNRVISKKRRNMIFDILVSLRDNYNEDDDL